VKECEEFPTFKEIFIIFYVIAFFVAFIGGICEGDWIKPHESCKPNTIAQYIVPSYSLGCAINRPLEHYYGQY